jgi:hypothetical protein
MFDTSDKIGPDVIVVHSSDIGEQAVSACLEEGAQLIDRANHRPVLECWFKPMIVDIPLDEYRLSVRL